MPVEQFQRMALAMSQLNGSSFIEQEEEKVPNFEEDENTRNRYGILSSFSRPRQHINQSQNEMQILTQPSSSQNQQFQVPHLLAALPQTQPQLNRQQRRQFKSLLRNMDSNPELQGKLQAIFNQYHRRRPSRRRNLSQSTASLVWPPPMVLHQSLIPVNSIRSSNFLSRGNLA